MKSAHRAAHRVIWLVLAPAIAVVIWLALAHRPAEPLNNALPGALSAEED